ncbi:MAG: hypothetical protein ACUVRD_05670 [Bacteroidia bacterium]
MKPLLRNFACLASLTCVYAQVGIGTTTPTHKLDVNGQARIRTLNAAVNPLRIVVADNQGVLQSLQGTADGQTLVWDAVNQQWTLGSGPQNAWLVGGNANITGIGDYLGTQNAQPLSIRTNGTQRILIDPNGVVQIDPTAGTTPRLVVEANGQIRINTPTPAKQVHIEGQEGLQVTVTGGAGGTGNLFTSTLNGVPLAINVAATTSTNAATSIGINSQLTTTGAIGIGVHGITTGATAKNIGLVGSTADPVAAISTWPNMSMGILAYNPSSVTGYSGTNYSGAPGAPHALYAQGRIYVEGGQIISNTPLPNPPININTPTGLPTGAGIRFMWLPEIGAYRMGAIIPAPDVGGAAPLPGYRDPLSPNATDHWDAANIAPLSFAAGGNVRATGVSSFVVGVGSRATQTGSTALGKWVATDHQGSFQIGDDPPNLAYQILYSTRPSQFSARFYNGYRFFTMLNPALNATPAPNPAQPSNQYPNAIPGIFISGKENHDRLGQFFYGFGDSWLGVGTQLPDAPIHIIGKSTNNIPRGILVDDGHIHVRGTGAFQADGQVGLTRVVNVMGSNGQPCTLTFQKGILVATTCP